MQLRQREAKRVFDRWQRRCSALGRRLPMPAAGASGCGAKNIASRVRQHQSRTRRAAAVWDATPPGAPSAARANAMRQRITKQFFVPQRHRTLRPASLAPSLVRVVRRATHRPLDRSPYKLVHRLRIAEAHWSWRDAR